MSLTAPPRCVPNDHLAPPPRRWTSAARCLAVAASLVLGACQEPDTPVGGDWYLRSVPADRRRHLDAHHDLLRKWNGVKVVVASFIGPVHRYYEPNCAMYEWPPFGTAGRRFRDVYFVCGDHWPARIAFMSAHGARMDADGLRPEPGVEMRPNSGVVGPAGELEPQPFIALADMRAAAERQPKSTRAIDPALRRANHVVLAALLIMAAGVALVMRWYRRVLRA